MSEPSKQRWYQKRRARDLPERERGKREADKAIEKLHTLWPAAFPKDPQSVKPLVPGIIPQVAASTGWSKPYATAVLMVWRSRDAYSEAVLRCPRYYDLNGEPTENPIDDAARERARQKLPQQ